MCSMYFGIIDFVLSYMYVSSLLLSSENMWHKAKWMGHPIRLELTRVSLSLNNCKKKKKKKYESLHFSGSTHFEIFFFSIWSKKKKMYIYIFFFAL